MRLVHTLAAIAALQMALPAAAADLSPAHWPAEERARLHQAEMGSFPIRAREVAGRSGLVAGTASSVAVHAGVQALAQGGTAADAAATVALTQIVRNLGATTSYAGKLELIYFEARTGKVVALDGGWGSYAGETDPAGIPAPDLSYLSSAYPAAGATAGVLGRQTLVPGFMAGIEALHARFGRLPFADLFQPAIWYAEDGMTLSAGRAGFLRQLQLLAAEGVRVREEPPMRVLGELRGSAITVVIDRPSGVAHAVELTTLDGYAEGDGPP